MERNRNNSRIIGMFFSARRASAIGLCVSELQSMWFYK